MKCPTCGYELKGKVKICPNCGAGMEDDSILQTTQDMDQAGSEGESAAAEDPAPVEEPVVSPIAGDEPSFEEPKKSKKWWLLLIPIAAVVAILIAVFWNKYYNEHYVVHEVHFAEKTFELLVDDTAQLSWEILPETAKDKSVTFTSSDDAVASVDENGLIRAIGSGSCEITVTTNNEITDTAQVSVKDLIDVQKESVEAVANYIRSNNPEEENGGTVTKIRDIDDEHSFALGTLGEDLVLCYREATGLESVGIDVQYTTYMNLGYGNISNAEIVQDNHVEIYGNPVVTTMRSSIALPEYQRGASVPITSLESNLASMEANYQMQQMFDSGVKGCFEEFRSFLEYHPELGCTVEDFGFTAKGDAPAPAPVVTDEVTSGVESMAESMAESMPEAAASSVTVVEDVMDPGSTDSTVSAVESAAETFVPATDAVTSAAEAVQAAGTEAAETIGDLAASGAEALETAGTAAAGAAIVGAAEDAAASTAEAVETVGTETADLAASGAEAIEAAGTAAAGAVEDTAASAAEAVAAVGTDIAETAGDLAASGAEAVEAAGTAVEEAAASVTEAVEAAAGDASSVVEDLSDTWETSASEDDVVSIVNEVENAAASAAESAIEAIMGTADPAEADAKAVAERAASAVESAVEETLSGYGEAAAAGAAAGAAAAEAGTAAARDALSTAESVAESMVESVASAVEEIAGDIAAATAAGTTDAPAAAESEAEKRFRSITESLSGATSVPFGPVAMVMC